MYRRNSDEGLRRLQRAAVAGDPVAEIEWIISYLRIYGCFENVPTLLNAISDISWFCQTHQRSFGRYSGGPSDCPSSIWTPSAQGFGKFQHLEARCCIIPQIRNIDEWINWEGHPHNLFSVKKQYHPEPTTPKELLTTFSNLHAGHRGFQLLGHEVLHYLRHDFGIALQLLAELRVTQAAVPTYFSQHYRPWTWDEFLIETNLRADLVSWPRYGSSSEGVSFLASSTSLTENGSMRARHYSQSVHCCPTNLSPMSLLRFSTMDRDFRGSWYVSGGGGIGITVEYDTQDRKAEGRPLRVELSYFG